ncbi:MAG: hypothetical protein ACT4QC_23245 [Planctomycetaceae bacterium]
MFASSFFRRGLAFLVACATVFFSVAAQAQLIGRRQTGLQLSLVAHPVVQKELGLDERKSLAAKALYEAYTTESQLEGLKVGIRLDTILKLQELVGKERSAKMREFSENSAAIEERLAKLFLPRVQALLAPAEFRRLQQILWQAGGSTVWNDPDLVQGLKLTPEQVAQISAINKEYVENQIEFLATSDITSANGEELMARLGEMTRGREEKALAVFTAAQQTRFTELKGQPFDLKLLEKPQAAAP